MPHIRVRGLEKEELIKISTHMIEKVSQCIDTPEDHFTLEYIPSTFIFKGQENSGASPFIEVCWFSRDEEAETETAKIITNLVKQFNYEYITVYFTNLVKNNYYENGVHF